MTESPQVSRTLLLVDDEVNVINALKRALRHEGYAILTANSGEQGLSILATQEVGVIISDNRMPYMTGVEFLRKVKVLYPKTLRMVLSGYTEIESVTRAINEGAIYKFLTKPWDDDLLRDTIREAFQYYDMGQENLRLTRELQSANDKLLMRNQNLEQKVAYKTQEMLHSINLLKISLEIFEHLPIGIIGIDEQKLIVVSNRCAESILCMPPGCLLGLMASDVLPEALLHLLPEIHSDNFTQFNGLVIALSDTVSVQVLISTMGDSSLAKGIVIILSPLTKH